MNDIKTTDRSKLIEALTKILGELPEDELAMLGLCRDMHRKV